jgi:hypothetical protein
LKETHLQEDPDPGAEVSNRPRNKDQQNEPKGRKDDCKKMILETVVDLDGILRKQSGSGFFRFCHGKFELAVEAGAMMYDDNGRIYVSVFTKRILTRALDSGATVRTVQYDVGSGSGVVFAHNS